MCDLYYTYSLKSPQSIWLPFSSLFPHSIFSFSLEKGESMKWWHKNAVGHINNTRQWQKHTSKYLVYKRFKTNAPGQHIHGDTTTFIQWPFSHQVLFWFWVCLFFVLFFQSEIYGQVLICHPHCSLWRKGKKIGWPFGVVTCCSNRLPTLLSFLKQQMWVAM